MVKFYPNMSKDHRHHLYEGFQKNVNPNQSVQRKNVPFANYNDSENFLSKEHEYSE